MKFPVYDSSMCVFRAVSSAPNLVECEGPEGAGCSFKWRDSGYEAVEHAIRQHNCDIVYLNCGESPDDLGLSEDYFPSPISDDVPKVVSNVIPEHSLRVTASYHAVQVEVDCPPDDPASGIQMGEAGVLRLIALLQTALAYIRKDHL